MTLLKLYAEDTFERYPGKLLLIRFKDGYEEYEFEKALNHRKSYGKLHYLIKWKHYPDHENKLGNREKLRKRTRNHKRLQSVDATHTLREGRI